MAEKADKSDRPARRSLLFTFVFGYACAWLPQAWAQAGSDAGLQSFLRLSAFLTGHSSLDPLLGAGLFAALCEDDPRYPERTQELLRLIEARQIDPLQVQQVLNAGGTGLDTLPREIVAMDSCAAPEIALAARNASV